MRVVDVSTLPWHFISPKWPTAMYFRKRTKSIKVVTSAGEFVTLKNIKAGTVIVLMALPLFPRDDVILTWAGGTATLAKTGHD